jgi:Uma2 family endonuclease
MSADPTPPELLVSTALLDTWYPPEPPTNLIFDDGEPLETNRHRIAMNALIRSVNQALAQRSDFFAGGNMFVYYSREQAMNRDFRGPDFFVALGVDGNRERQGWVVWEEGGRYPDVIVELLSDSTAKMDRGVKKDLYEQIFKAQNYFVFDPFDPSSLQGWRIETGRYQPLHQNEQGWLWCEALNLWLGTWDGVIDREPVTGTCSWLRFYDPQGNLVPLPEESAQAEVEHERQRAEQEQQRAEQERQRAEQERQRAEQAEDQLQSLLTRLRAQGIDPNGL